MKIDMIDLVDFFDDKYRNYDNNLGLAATSIITEKQMITRISDSILKSHFDAEGSMMSDVFGFDKNLFKGFGYDKELYDKLDYNHQKLLGEVVVIKYINNSTGNLILIYLPLEQKTITENQLEVIKYLSECIENASYKISKPIKIRATNRIKKVVEINTLDYMVIPFFSTCVNNNYIQSVKDEVIIAKDDLREKTLKLNK